MKNLIKLLPLVIILALFSCKTDEALVKNENIFFGAVNLQDNLDKFGAYKDALTYHDGYQGMKHNLSGPFSSSKSHLFGGYTEATSDLDVFSVNNVTIEEFVSWDIVTQHAFMERNIGKQVTFRHTSKDGKILYEESMRMPLHIKVYNEKSGITKIPKGNIGQFNRSSNMYYTADPENKNGLLLSFTYRGYKLETSLDDIENMDASSPYVENYMYVPVDNGIINFPEGFFEGIPNGGIIHMQIDRLNTKVFDLEGHSHKLSTGTTIGLDLAIVR